MRAMLLLALAGCDINFFDKPENYSTDIPCSPEGHCPPEQVCAAGENRCHRRCTTPGPCMGGNCECSGHNGNSDECDPVDLLCRPACNGNSGDPNMCQPGSGCADPSFVCDTATNICRPPCNAAGTCATGLRCVDRGSCPVCRPGIMSVSDGGGSDLAGADLAGIDLAANGGADLSMPNTPIVVRNDATHVRLLLLDQGQLIWDQDRAIFTCPTTNCSAPQKVADTLGNLVSMASANGRVVWNDGTGIYSCLASSCPGMAGQLLAGNQTLATFVAADIDTAYWTLPSPSPLLALYGCDILTCAGGPKLLGAKLGGGTSPGGALAANGIDIYWSTVDGNILRCPRTGCNPPGAPPQLGVLQAACPMMQVTASTGFFANGLNIDSCALGSCSLPSHLTIAAGASVQGFISDGIDVYWTLSSEVRHCTVSTCSTMFETLTATQGSTAIVLDNQFIYWAENSSGTIMKMAR